MAELPAVTESAMKLGALGLSQTVQTAPESEAPVQRQTQDQQPDPNALPAPDAPADRSQEGVLPAPGAESRLDTDQGAGDPQVALIDKQMRANKAAYDRDLAAIQKTVLEMQKKFSEQQEAARVNPIKEKLAQLLAGDGEDWVSKSAMRELLKIEQELKTPAEALPAPDAPAADPRAELLKAPWHQEEMRVVLAKSDIAEVNAYAEKLIAARDPELEKMIHPLERYAHVKDKLAQARIQHGSGGQRATRPPQTSSGPGRSTAPIPTRRSPPQSDIEAEMYALFDRLGMDHPGAVGGRRAG